MKTLINLENVKKLIDIALKSVDVSKIKKDIDIPKNVFTNEEDYGYPEFKIKVAKNKAIENLFSVVLENVYKDIVNIKTDGVVFHNNLVSFLNKYHQIFQDNREKMYKNRDNYKVLNDKIKTYFKDALFIFKEDSSSESLNDFYAKSNQAIIAISESFNKHIEALLKSIDNELDKKTIEAIVQKIDIKKEEALNNIERQYLP